MVISPIYFLHSAYLLTTLSLVLFIKYIIKKQTNALISAFWLSLLALIACYFFTNKQLFGPTMTLKATIAYTMAIILLMTSILFLGFKITAPSWVKATVITICLLAFFIVLTNIYQNLYFISQKMANRPIIEIANFNKNAFCHGKRYYLLTTKEKQTIGLCPFANGLFSQIKTFAKQNDHPKHEK